MKRVLIIDDEPGIREILRYFLEAADWEVETASRGQEGLDLYAEDPPDVVLVDVMMPGMDGYEVIRRLRDAGATARLVLLTANGAVPPAQAELARLGIDRYFTKPFDGAALVATLEQDLAG